MEKNPKLQQFFVEKERKNPIKSLTSGVKKNYTSTDCVLDIFFSGPTNKIKTERHADGRIYRYALPHIARTG